MTSLSWLIYAISTISNLQTFLYILMAVSGFAAMVMFVPAYIEQEEGLLKWVKRAVITALVSGFFLVFVPDKEYLIMIAGAEVTNVVLQQDSVKQAGSQLGGLSNDAITLLRNYIQQQNEVLNKSDKK